MYCKNCGREIDDNAVICVGCGVYACSVLPPANAKQRIVGFILSLTGFFFPLMYLAGLIVSITEYVSAKNEGGAKGFPLAGILISAIMMGLILLVIVLVIYILAATAPYYYQASY